MSKKSDIKFLKKELKGLKAEVRKLKLASASRRKNKMSKALGRATKSPAPSVTKAEKSPDGFAITKRAPDRAAEQP